MAHGPPTPETRHLRTLFALGAAGTLTDGQLLERFAGLRGDPAELAFATLVDRHGSMVLRVARSALVDEPSAHDAFQATFLILARKARSLWVRDSLGPWLHAVALRVANQARAAESRRRRFEKEAARPEAIPPVEAARDDLARAIHQEIDRLPHPHRLAVVACHLEGLTQHEAAARLGWPVGTLQSRLARGRQKLRDRLRRRGLAPSLGTIAGKVAPVPPSWVASTAKLASTLHLGGPLGAMIPPGVLDLIETTTKGMLMTKLKFAALALLVASGIVGQGIGRGVGQVVPTTDEKAPVAVPDVSPQIPPAAVPPALVPAPNREPEAESVPEPLTLLYFYANWAEACRQMKPEIERLIKTGYPIRQVEVDSSPESGLGHKVRAVPTYLVVSARNEELARLEGKFTASQVAQLYNETLRKIRDQASKSDSSEPEMIGPKPAPPRPWETVVRVKIPSPGKDTGFSSGTIIDGASDRTIILTSAHNFEKGQVEYTTKHPSGNYRGEILVNLTDGQLRGLSPATIRCLPESHKARLTLIDFDLDLALIEIAPGRTLPASPVPNAIEPVKGMRMYALGCSNGGDATAWDTSILDPNVVLRKRDPAGPMATIKCGFEPRPGRSGGGLFTTDGYLLGVCLFADPNEKVGLYARPESIRKMLDRAGLSLPPGRDDTPAFAPLVEPPKVAGPEPLLVPGVPGDGSIRRHATEPVPPSPVSDQDRRMNDLERKLDQVLKSLQALQGGNTPFRSHGGLGP